MNNKFQHPFENDMLGVVWESFKILYPEKVKSIKSIKWVENIHDFVQDNEDETTLGVTKFDTETNEASIMIDANISVCDSVYVLAHELAHVAVGYEHEHDDMFKEAFDSINIEYNKIVDSFANR